MPSSTVRLTVAQALIRYLHAQWVERDGESGRFIGQFSGIFGHGNIAGLGQALDQERLFKCIFPRNEQAMVLSAVGYAKSQRRLRAMACTSSIGPGATNMVTGAATATVNNVPVLILPGDIFARRNVAPVLQQVEARDTQDTSVNDCFKPVSRYWDRIQRPEQLLTALPEAMRVLTSPSETGAVVISLPQDVQTEAYDYPVNFFKKRTWRIVRQRPDSQSVSAAVRLIESKKKPVVICGGGVIYSGAEEVLASFATEFGIAVVETNAGKSSLIYDHPFNLGAGGHTGTLGANRTMRDADLVIGVGTRYGDFITESKTAFQNPEVEFININTVGGDAGKHGALGLIGDAKAVLEELKDALKGYATSADYQKQTADYNRNWDKEVERIYGLEHGPKVSQGEVIGAVNEAVGADGIVVSAAGSLPGDMHKLWRSRHVGQYHMEYGYSCMGYEIAGALGVKMAHPKREVFVLLGDGSYQMMSAEIATSVQEGCKLNIVLIDNYGHLCIWNLGMAVGAHGYGTLYRERNPASGELDGEPLNFDYVANAASMGAHAQKVTTIAELKDALRDSLKNDKTTVTVIETDPLQFVGGYESWWDVAVAEVASEEDARKARAKYEEDMGRQRYYYGTGT